MLTPVDVQNKVFKGGIGFDKKDVEAFMSELASDYGMLYRSNVELKDKVATLDESLQHYRSIEESMQKALTLSEKTAEETINAANDKARQINTEAEKKAEALLADAKAELQETKDEIYRLQKQHATFKEQFTKILEAQRKIMDGEMIDIDLGADFEPSYSDSGFGNFSGGGLGSEGGLGGLGSGGGYVGSNSFDEGMERTNQDPAINRGTLNMDPFADAMNGGGRFSRQTGGSFNGNSKKKSTSGTGNTASKPTLNVKNAKPGAAKVRKNFTAAASDSDTTVQTAQPASEKVQRTVQPDTQPVKPAPVDSKPAQMGGNTAAPVHNKPVPDTEPVQVAGEVEDKINESTMLDSEDNYSTGFDFVSEDDVAAAAESQPAATADFFDDFDDSTVTGEVEDKINEATMLDSEDNYDDGFNFVSEDDLHTDEDAYSGEVEDKINESNMLDSEDNYTDGFDFIVGEDSESEEIPTILPNFAGNNSNSASLNINPFQDNSDEDVLTGDVEDNPKQSNLIGNEDDDEEGFNFL